MTRSARRRRDRVTVDQLLRETGAIPRKLASGPRSASRPADRPPRQPIRPDLEPVIQDREAAARLERRVEAVSGPRRIAPRTRRNALLSGVGVMLGGLVLLMLASGRAPENQATLPFVPLPPASSSKLEVTEQPPAVSATPDPVVMSATQTKPKLVIPDAPVVTTTLPEPSGTPAPTTPVMTITLSDYCPNYPYCYTSGGGGRHH